MKLKHVEGGGVAPGSPGQRPLVSKLCFSTTRFFFFIFARVSQTQ